MRELELDGILAHHRGLALFLPAKTPQATVQALYREAARIVALPEVRERFQKLGLNPIGGPSAEFKPFVANAIKRMAEAARIGGVEPE